MKKSLFIVLLLAFAMVGCQEQGSSDPKEGENSEMIDAPTGDEAKVPEEKEKPPRQEIVPKLPDGATSVLAGLSDMAYDEAFEIDDFRERLEFGMGSVNDIMVYASPMFEEEGDYLVARGEMEKDGNKMEAIVVADPANDCLHGASYDAASGKVMTYTDHEGMEAPKPIKDWADKHK